MKRSTGRLMAAVVLAIVAGCIARVANLDTKVFFQDEAYSALRITGHTQDAYLRTFDGAVHPVARVLAFQRLDAASSPRATLSSIAAEEPQRGPLYYTLAALWVRFAGTSIVGFRSLSVLIGLLEIGAAYYFGKVFFERPNAAALLAAFVAVSPFHIRYAQQAREYGLIGFAVFATTACLVWALRGGRGRWLAYTFACAAGLSTSPLFALVIVSHAAYVLYEVRTVRGAWQVLAAYAGATAAGILAIAPWYVYASRSAGTVGDQTEWAASPYPVVFALTKWLFNVGATFFDYEFADVRLAAVLVVLLPLVALAVLRAFKHERRATVMVLALGLPTLVAFVVKDRLSHAHFATIPRYLTPVWIALEIAVAAGLASGLLSASRVRRRTSVVTIGFVLACGLWSAAADSRARIWWDNSDNEPTTAVADVINAAAHPLVASSNVAITLSLVHYLRREARVQLYARDDVPADLKGPRRLPNATYFLFLPSQSERTAIARSATPLRNVSPGQDTIVRSFHVALRRERPGVHDSSMLELSAANALWQVATQKEAPRAGPAGNE